MGFNWVSDNISDVWLLDTLVRPPFSPRHRRPPRLRPLYLGTADSVLALLLAAVAESVAGGTWNRLKACKDPGCRWAYYDQSRNRSRAWCSMAACGNRAKARAFRDRAR